MTRPSISPFFRTGIIAGAATAGAVIGVGLRRGDMLGPFMNAGRALLSLPSGLTPLPWLALVSGLVLHTVVMLVIGGTFALVASRFRGVVLAAAAALYTTGFALLAETLGIRVFGAFGSLAASRVQWLSFLAILAVALIAGVRWSRVSPQH